MTHPCWPFSTSPTATGRSSRTSIPSVHETSPRALLGHHASVTVTATAILFHRRLPVPLCSPPTLAILPSAFHQPTATSCLMDQRPGDGSTRKAGFKIIMARAILITVARTTTVSGWHHYYHYAMMISVTPPTTLLVYLFHLISHCTYLCV